MTYRNTSIFGKTFDHDDRIIGCQYYYFDTVIKNRKTSLLRNHFDGSMISFMEYIHIFNGSERSLRNGVFIEFALEQ